MGSGALQSVIACRQASSIEESRKGDIDNVCLRNNTQAWNRPIAGMDLHRGSWLAATLLMVGVLSERLAEGDQGRSSRVRSEGTAQGDPSRDLWIRLRIEGLAERDESGGLRVLLALVGIRGR